MERDDQKIACIKPNMQHLWPEASWPSLEQIHGQRHAKDWFYAKQIHPMPLLSQDHRLPHLYQ